MSKPEPAYQRILLKLSGEALMGGGEYGISPAVIERIAGEVLATALFCLESRS